MPSRARIQARLVSCVFMGATRYVSTDNLDGPVFNDSSSAIHDVRTFLVFQGTLHSGDPPGEKVIRPSTPWNLGQPLLFGGTRDLSLGWTGVTFRDNAGLDSGGENGQTAT